MIFCTCCFTEDLQRNLSLLSKTVLACIAMVEQSKDQKAKKKTEYWMLFSLNDLWVNPEVFSRHFTLAGDITVTTTISPWPSQVANQPAYKQKGSGPWLCTAKVRTFHTFHAIMHAIMCEYNWGSSRLPLPLFMHCPCSLKVMQICL